MNIYIDLGCYDGDTVEQFRNWSKISFPDKTDWKIYAFDINDKFKNRWRKKSDDSTVFEKKAAWIEDGEIEVAIESTATPLGSTLMPSKIEIWNNHPHVRVKCFDFSDWVKQFKDDFVVVKMDIEGAEFPILEKMIRDNTIYIPNKLMVEFHPNKVRDYTTTYMNELVDKIRGLGVELVKWH